MKNTFVIQLIRKDGTKETVEIAKENYALASGVDCIDLVKRHLMYKLIGREMPIDFQSITHHMLPIANALIDSRLPRFGTSMLLVKHMLNSGIFKVSDRFAVADALNDYLKKTCIFETEGTAICETYRNAISVIKDISTNYEYFVFEYSADLDSYRDNIFVEVKNVFDFKVLSNNVKKTSCGCPICDAEALIPKSVLIENVNQVDIDILRDLIKNKELHGSITVLDKSNNVHDDNGNDYVLIPKKTKSKSSGKGLKDLIKEYPNNTDDLLSFEKIFNDLKGEVVVLDMPDGKGSYFDPIALGESLNIPTFSLEEVMQSGGIDFNIIPSFIAKCYGKGDAENTQSHSTQTKKRRRKKQQG